MPSRSNAFSFGSVTTGSAAQVSQTVTPRNHVGGHLCGNSTGTSRPMTGRMARDFRKRKWLQCCSGVPGTLQHCNYDSHCYIVMTRSIVTDVSSDLRSQLRTRNAQYTPAYSTSQDWHLIPFSYQEPTLDRDHLERFITGRIFEADMFRFFAFLIFNERLRAGGCVRSILYMFARSSSSQCPPWHFPFRSQPVLLLATHQIYYPSHLAIIVGSANFFIKQPMWPNTVVTASAFRKEGADTLSCIPHSS